MKMMSVLYAVADMTLIGLIWRLNNMKIKYLMCAFCKHLEDDNTCKVDCPNEETE